MKRVLIISLMTIITLSLVFPIGCADKETAPYRIDRQITGQVTAIENRDDYSTLHFGNEIEVVVTNATLYQWRTDNMFINVWTYKFQETFYENRYDLIGIEDEFLEDKTVIIKQNEGEEK